MKLDVHIERWPRKAPLRITGYVFDVVETVRVTLSDGEATGQGEASPVYYKGESALSIAEQIEGLRGAVDTGLTRESLVGLIGAGGARNALDCALWDFEAKQTGVSVWKRASLPEPRPILTAYTLGANEPDQVAAAARSHAGARALKLKLNGDELDAERVKAAREARADVWLGVDANQGFDRANLERLMPELIDCGVQLIEQPFPIGKDAWLDTFQSPIPIAADESIQTRAELTSAVGRFEVVNIKLDKAGGFTEALALLREAQALGLRTMVGNMMGTSLAMAPPFLLGQCCDVVDLDGPMFLKSDRSTPSHYVDGMIWCPPELWGTKRRD